MKREAKKTTDYEYGFHVKSRHLYKTGTGLTKEIVAEISAQKNEPDWMRRFRLESFEIFKKKKMPSWGPDLNAIDLDGIHYYLKPTDRPERDWNDVPYEIKETFERLGVPQAERAFLAGSGAQFESEMIYHNLEETLKKKGVIFLSTDDALKQYPELFREHFGTVVPARDNKFAALNSAVWSGGSFIYVPKGVKVGLPLQAYFRINAKNMGQFERTLIVVDEGADVHYVEGCTAPTYSSDSLHAAVVEIIVKKGARCQYTTIQNWSHNVYNLVTKRAFAEENAVMFWLDCNIGSKLTMKYPAVYLKGRGARAEVLSVAVANKGQQQDTGAKIFHLAPETSSSVRAKSISKGGGRSSYRGFLKLAPGMKDSKAKVACDALILDDISRSDTYPKISVEEDDVTVEHEATVSRIGEEQLFYLMSRGLSEQEAATMIVNGFIDPIVKQLPMEYAVEMNRLVEMEMEGSVG
jgi:Fe-S cluster assembly protein SufB